MLAERTVQAGKQAIPDAFQVHWANFYYVTCFLTFQDPVPATSSHTSNIEELCTVYHMVICRPC